jgi:hypothetical protein
MKKLITQIKLIFLVSGDTFSQEDFSRLININPSNTWNKGDEITIGSQYRKDNVFYRKNETVWEFTEGFIETLDFDDISKRFDELFCDKVHVIKGFVKEYSLNVNINVVVEIVNVQPPSLSLSKNFISILKDLDAEIDFDIYIYDEE